MRIPTDCEWRFPDKDISLSDRDVHVWRASLDQSPDCVDQLAQALSPDEQMRAERFYFDRDRKRFMVARGLLRTILSYYLGVEPSQLQFCYGSHGKPALAEAFDESRIRFNLSHSQGLALYAVTRDREIGIDLEQIRSMPKAEQLAERFFSAPEYEILRTLPMHLKEEAFFNAWTRKEAYLKASGKGLAQSLEQIEVSLEPGESAKLLSIAGSPQKASAWSIQELLPASGYVGAVVVEGHNWHLTCWQCPE
jgi:4'-phosphopantetheinyl transferase